MLKMHRTMADMMKAMGGRKPRADGGARQYARPWRRHAEPGADAAVRGTHAGRIARHAARVTRRFGSGRPRCRAWRRKLRAVRCSRASAAGRRDWVDFQIWKEEVTCTGHSIRDDGSHWNVEQTERNCNNVPENPSRPRRHEENGRFIHIVIADSRSPRDGASSSGSAISIRCCEGQDRAPQARFRKGQGLACQRRAADRPGAALSR